MTIYRQSPITMPAQAAETEERGGWNVVLSYEAQGDGPWLIDLSHTSRFDYQDGPITGHQVFGLDVPEGMGECLVKDGWSINRMNGTQCYCWRLDGQMIDQPEGRAYTDITDSQALLAVLGTDPAAIMERASNLDLFSPARTAPFLTQGPACHVPCQIVTLPQADGLQAVVMGFSRGYGQAVAEGLLSDCGPLGLKPGGESVFRDHLAKLG